MDDWNKKLNEDLTSYKLDEYLLSPALYLYTNYYRMKISKRIKEGIKLRLSYEAPYINNWHQVKFKVTLNNLLRQWL